MVKCVVVDDNQEILDVFCELLELSGVEVLGYGNNGKEAAELYEKHRPEVIFVDLSMPEYDGVYAISKILKIDPDAKIIVVTGDLNAEESYKLDSYKIASIIYKPFDMHAVKQALVDALLI